MANITVQTSVPINMDGTDMLNFMSNASVGVYDHQQFQMTNADGSLSYDFTGSFPTWDQHGIPNSGQVNNLTIVAITAGSTDYVGGYMYSSGGTQTTAMQMSGLNVDVNMFRAAPTTGNESALWSAIGQGDDVIVTGPNTANDVHGFDGNDSIAGSSGADTLDGGAGNDSLDGGDGGDTINGGDGADVVRGLDGNDTIDGGKGADDLNGNKGDDVVHGGDDADFVRGGQGADTVFGDGGADIVNGNIGDDVVHGGDDNDTVFGGQGNDQLFGDNGDDLLSGDLGDDTLTGGPGADRFAFRPGSGHDVVTDFNAAEGDRIQLPTGTAFTLTTVNGAAVVDLGGGDTLTLNGVAQADPGWIVFA